MTKHRPIHPIFFGLYPGLTLYSLNSSMFPICDTALPILVVLAGTLIVWTILSLILRSVERAAVGASLFVLLFFAFGHVWNFILQSPEMLHFFSLQRSYLIPVWAVIVLIAMVLGCRKWKNPERLTATMNLGGVILFAIPVVSIALSLISASRTPVVHELANKADSLTITDRPDIYYIILDAYGRNDSLKRVIGYDDGFFVKGLQDRGFFVAKDGHSNYCQTELSLSSSLNLDYLQTLLPNQRKDDNDRKIFDRLIDRNQVASYLRRIGYRYEAVTTGFPAVYPKSADLLLTGEQPISLFAASLIDETPIPRSEGVSESMFVQRRNMLNGAISNLEGSAIGGLQPRFVFAHILAPHPPFVFGPNGEPRRPKGMGYTIVDASDFMLYGGTPADYKQGYTEQATYIGKRILEMVDVILAKSPKRPIIVIQGDHGSKLKMDQVYLNKSDVNECFPNLNAYLVPPNVRANLYDGITPVNSFRMIFNGLFHDKLERLADDSYYSSWLTPFDFINVTDRIKPSSAWARK